jgi:excisionase family DNA binding protein
MPEKELLTAAEAAERLKIAKRTLLRWARDNRIECVRISHKKVLFTEQAIEAFVKWKTSAVESFPRVGHGAGKHHVRGRRMKGGGKKSSRKSWRNLREEVTTWQ